MSTIKRNKIPPTSMRFCECCEDFREFLYNKIIGHSVCVKCGNFDAKKGMPYKVFLKKKAKYETEFGMLRKKLINLRKDYKKKIKMKEEELKSWD